MATLNIDKGRTALLIMDYQQAIIGNQPEARRTLVLDRAARALEAARAAGVLVTYVVVRLRPGYPDVSPRNKRFSGMKAAGTMQEGTEAVEIHPTIAPRPGEPVVTKRRVGAFSRTDLEVVLDAHDITTLVLFGISTSGCVLTTVRSAADMDYDLVVLEDCCSDPNPDLHRMLVETVFPTQATVASTEEFIAALRSG